MHPLKLSTFHLIAFFYFFFWTVKTYCKPYLFLLQRSIKSFGVGFCIQAAVKVIGALPSLFKKPSAIVKALGDKDNLHLGLFLGSYTALFKVWIIYFT